RMQAKYRRFGVITGFIVLLALLLVNTAVIHRQVSKQVASHSAVVHTNEILIQLERTESLLKDAETGQRGYLYTGEPGYLEPYEAARRQIDASIDQLSLLTSDNPRHQDRIALLRKLSQSKLNELAETISLYQSGHAEDARKLVLTDRGKHTMDQIRGVVAEMIQEEHALDAQRSAEFTRDVRFSNLCILLM